jgi:predicted dehydrogenase
LEYCLRAMNSSTLRWGILGTANVARKNWRALRLAGNATLAAVASRGPGQARRFIDECQAEVPFPTTPVAYDRYEDLLASPEVDAVYLPLPTGPRKT